MSIDISRDIVVDVAGLECAFAELDDVFAVRSRLVKAGRLSIDIAHQLDSRLGLEHEMADLYLKPSTRSHYGAGMESIGSRVVSLATNVIEYIIKTVSLLIATIMSWRIFKWAKRDKSKGVAASANNANSATLVKLNEVAGDVQKELIRALSELRRMGEDREGLSSLGGSAPDQLQIKRAYQDAIYAALDSFIGQVNRHSSSWMFSNKLRAPVIKSMAERDQRLAEYLQAVDVDLNALNLAVKKLVGDHRVLTDALSNFAQQLTSDSDPDANIAGNQLLTGGLKLSIWLSRYPTYTDAFIRAVGTAEHDYGETARDIKALAAAVVARKVDAIEYDAPQYESEKIGSGSASMRLSDYCDRVSEFSESARELTKEAAVIWQHHGRVEERMLASLTEAKQTAVLLQEQMGARHSAEKAAGSGEFSLFADAYTLQSRAISAKITVIQRYQSEVFKTKRLLNYGLEVSNLALHSVTSLRAAFERIPKHDYLTGLVEKLSDIETLLKAAEARFDRVN